MENRGILNWRLWSATRQGAVVGALTGGLLTVALQASAILRDCFHDYGVAYLALATMIPRGLLWATFGWEATGDKPTWGGTFLDAIINSLLLALVGMAIGFMARHSARIVRNIRSKNTET